MDMAKLRELKNAHKTRMEMYAENITDYIAKEGNSPSDYLSHRQCMESYHRGAFDAYEEIEKMLCRYN